jgi:hypothetical protein
MGFLIVLVVFLLFAVVVPRASAGTRQKLLASGKPARGLVLRASSSASATTISGQRFEVRRVTLDVEPQGGDPYEVSLTAQFPRMCESFPGTALDLRIDPRNQQNVTIVGPAGSSAWIGAAAWLPQMGGPNPAARGCGIAFVVLVSVFLAGGAAISFLASDDNKGNKHGEPSPHETPEPEPEPTPTHAVPIAPIAADCEAAARCCATLGQPHSKCTAFTKMPESACKTALHELTHAATKAGKKCK